MNLGIETEMLEFKKSTGELKEFVWQMKIWLCLHKR